MTPFYRQLCNFRAKYFKNLLKLQFLLEDYKFHLGLICETCADL